MADFRILDGLPPYGDLPRPFPADWGRLGREGVVVEFRRPSAGAWVGNFARGLGGLSEALPHPDGRQVVVIAGGDVWVVDPDSEAADCILPAADAVWPVDAPAGFVLSRQGLAFARLGPTGLAWHTRRLSWDGFDRVTLGDAVVSGLAWDAVNERWEPFAVELATGASTGGAYGDTDPEGWERLAIARGAA
jgi:hypothetical protein